MIVIGRINALCHIPGIPPYSFTAQAHFVNTAPPCGVYCIKRKQPYPTTNNTVMKQREFAPVKHRPTCCLLKLVLF
jgi:hypothetical protein